MKPNRKKIHQKFGGKCAYCGTILEDESGKFMQVDHVKPIRRHYKTGKAKKPANENIENMFPSCPRCNNYKHTMNIDKFREEIKLAISRLEKNASFRNASRYGMIEIKEWDGIFWFEKFIPEE